MSNQDEFKKGFIEGYKSVMGSSNVTIPQVPTMTTIPTGKTAFQFGIQRGVEEGQKRKDGKK